MDTTVWVTHRFEGMHAWPDAPPHRAYLRDQHRHLFHVRVEVAVTDDDRQIEFHDLLDVVSERCDGLGNSSSFGKRPVDTSAGPAVITPSKPVRMLGPMSCEMIARNLAAAVERNWPGVPIHVDVSEDGEVGGSVTINAD